MRLRVVVRGRELLLIETGRDVDDGPPRGEPDYLSTPVGFVPQPGDQRWQPGLDP